MRTDMIQPPMTVHLHTARARRWRRSPPRPPADAALAADLCLVLAGRVHEPGTSPRTLGVGAVHAGGPRPGGGTAPV